MSRNHHCIICWDYVNSEDGRIDIKKHYKLDGDLQAICADCAMDIYNKIFTYPIIRD